MALSLADELAGAFESGNSGLGQSLADEFGLDFDQPMEENYLHTGPHGAILFPIRVID